MGGHDETATKMAGTLAWQDRLFLLCIWLVFPKHRIKTAGFEIERGMTMEEVVAITRVPPGDYSTGPLESRASEKIKIMRELCEEQFRAIDPTLILRREEWITDEGTLFVFFGEGGKVVNQGFSISPMNRLEPMNRAV